MDIKDTEEYKSTRALLNKITMKQETLEEFISEVTKNFKDEMSIKFTSGGIKLGAKWQQEDMIDKLEMHILINEDDWNRNPQAQFRNFIEQFKKK